MQGVQAREARLTCFASPLVTAHFAHACRKEISTFQKIPTFILHREKHTPLYPLSDPKQEDYAEEHTMNSVAREHDRANTPDDRSLIDVNLLPTLPITFLPLKKRQ